MKWATYSYIDTGTGNTFGTNYVLRANSLFDPNYTASGSTEVNAQPKYFDTFSYLYNNYRVNKVSYKITFQNTAVTGAGCYAAINLYPDSADADSNLNSGSMTYILAKECPTIQVRRLGNNAQGSGCVTFKGTLDIPKSFGVSKTKYLGDSGFEAQCNANPSRTLYLQLGIANLLALDDQVQAYITIELTFHAKFWSYLDPGQS